MELHRHKTRRLMVAGGVLAAGGWLATGPGAGCTSFALESLLVTTDFCFIFDCQNGAFGGTVDPCPDGLPGGPTEQPLFTDCL